MKRATTAVFTFLVSAAVIAAASGKSFELDWGQKKVEAPAAWAAGVRGRGVTIAILSTGVNGNLPALRGSIYMNAREIPWNGVDDDGNGYIDDTAGWNFAESNPWVVEENSSFGTNLATIVAANPAFGQLQGIAPESTIMILKVLDEKGTAKIDDVVHAMDYAANQGARIVLCPFSGAQNTPELAGAIDRLAARGVLVVAAAGNDYSNIGTYPTYPSGYIKPNLISVASSSSYDYLSYYSNYGEPVDLSAPGDSISVYNLDGDLEYADGTQPAAAFVAGAAALVWSQTPSLTANEVKKKIFDSVDKKGFPVASKGRLNIRKALGLSAGP